MSDLWQYSSDKFNVSYLGLDLTPALIEGSSLVMRTTAPDVSYRKDGLGGGIYVWTADRSGELDLYMSPAHPTHQKLMSLFLGIRASQLIVGPIFLDDLWNKQRTFLTGAIPTKLPDEQRGSELAPVVWTFLFANRFTIPNLLQRNSV